MRQEEYNPDTGLFLYWFECDGSDCEEKTPKRGSDLISMSDAIALKWLVGKPERKFSGIARRDYCPKCAKKEGG